MNVNRVLEVPDGKPVDAFQDFLLAFWQRNQLQVMLAPVEQPDHTQVTVQVVRDPQALSAVNPFAPVMSCNSAVTALRFIQQEDAGRLAVLLRPCELRALVELAKRNGGSAGATKAGNGQKCVAVLAVDCLGTLPEEEWRSIGMEQAIRQTLRNAATGGLMPQNFRTACQVCDWPAPRGADVVIGTVGVDTENCLLVISQDEKVDARLGLQALTSAPASEYQVSRRETLVGAVAEARADVRRRLLGEADSELRFSDLGSFLAWFANCNLCGQCLKACPLYEEELKNIFGDAHPEGSPLTALVRLSHWITSCSGCGMCEAKCSRDVPLMLLISALSHRVREEMHYQAGNPAQKLPWSCV
jgi:formate dehydrogenase subunit beta